MSEITSSARLVGGTSVTCTARADGMDLFIGTFTNKGSKGIYRSHIDLASGSLTTPNLAAEALQPSWLRWHPSRQDIIYCANEDRDAPACSAYRVCARGRLQLLNTVSTGAAGPTHFSVSPDGRFLAVANYGGGALTVIPTAEDGSLRPASATIMHTGSGPNPKRQREPHAHSASFSACGRFIFCCDLGIDQVVIYELHPDGTVETRGSGTTAPGGGPRHLAVHPSVPVVYMNTEMLPCRIEAYDWDVTQATLTSRQTVPTLPAEYDGPNGTSELLLNSSATKLYCANRGHDSLVVYDVLENGDLRGPLAHVPTGRHPRNFNIDPSGQWLLVGNAHDDNVAVYAVSPDTGIPSATGDTIPVPTPTRILFAPPLRLTTTANPNSGAARAATVVHSNGTTVHVVTSP